MLLDTHALIWLLAGDPLRQDALERIAASQAESKLLISPISAWEASLALQKQNYGRRPNIQLPVSEWFKFALRLPGTKLVPIKQKIALEAAKVPAIYGQGDPGDCYLIATARVRKVPLVTRDTRILTLARQSPEYLTVVEC